MDTTEIKKEVKRLILTSSYESHACHLGSSLSCSDIIVDLYFNRMKPNDIFIFGKASGVAALYATLALKGVFPKEKVAYYLKRYPLADKRVKGVFCSMGSLGHALPVSCGVAYSNRSRNVYCLIGDADCQEGTFWESLLFARQHRLCNLHIIVDQNNLQACGRVGNILFTADIVYDLSQRLFPIEVHDTIKGDGISFLADKIESHYHNLNESELNQALSEIK